MSSQIHRKHSLNCSKEWANRLLRYGIKILREWWISPNSHHLAVFYKITLVNNLAEQLAKAGYWWQSKRLLNHLHRYLGGVQIPPTHLQPKADPLLERGGEASSVTDIPEEEGEVLLV